MTPRETTVAATVVDDMLQYLAQRGVSTDAALSAAGIDPAFRVSPGERVPGSRVERLLSFAVDQTGMSRGHLLELTIIAILVFELILFFMGVMR